MAKQFLYSLIFLFLFYVHPLAWSQDSETRSILPFAKSRIGVETWGMGGAGVADRGNVASPLYNPAALVANGLSLYIESGRAFRSTFLGLDADNHFFLPGYLSLATSIGNANLALGYAKSYDLQVEGGPETPEPLPDGTGAVVGWKARVTIQTLFGTFAYTTPINMAFGVTLGLNYMKEDQKIGSNIASRGDGVAPKIKIGFLYAPSEVLTLGSSFQYSHEINYDAMLTLPEPDTTNPRNRNLIVRLPTHVKTKFPWSIQLGMTYKATSVLYLSAMLDYLKWSSALPNQSDEVEIHFGVKATPTRRFACSVGFSTINYSTPAYNLDQKLLTLGIKWEVYNNVDFSGTFLDGHLFSGGQPKQTYVGVGLHFHGGNI